jgi:flagellar motor switch protein FliN/FliY
VQLTEAGEALTRVLGHADAALVALRGASAVRAGIAIGLDAARNEPAADPDVPNHRLDLLRGVQMEATAELGRARMTINDLLSLRNGAVIELDRPAGGPADLFVNGQLIARGEVVVIDENFGLRITQVVTAETGR